MALDKLKSDMITDGTIVNADIADVAATKLTGTIADARIPASAVSQHVTEYNDASIRADILNLALNQAIADNRIAFNLDNSFVDGFEDDTGITTETNVDRNTSGEYVSVVGGAFVNDSNTKYLNHFEASNLNTDESSGSHSIVHTGTGISRSSTQAKFGTYSMAGNGANTAFIRLPAHSDFAFSTNVDCTIEGWFRVPNVSGNKGLWGTVGVDFVLFVKSATLGYYVSSNGSSWNVFNNSSGSQTVAANTWHHFAVVREGSTFTSYLDGVVDKTTSSSTIDLSQQFNLGSDIGTGTGVQSWGLNGYLDEVRFSNTARYTGAFTPSTEATTGTLISDAQTASSSRTSCSGVIMYENEIGSATLGTDLKIYFTANNGTNWTEAASYGTATTYTGGKKLVKLGATTVTGGTQIALKGVWANQAPGSKVTRLHGWAVNY